MKVRKSKYLEKVLKKKGFKLDPEIDHHRFFYLYKNNKKYPIYTYISHGLKEYDKNLMSEIKKQLKFENTKDAELFFDCPMTGDKYCEYLERMGEI